MTGCRDGSEELTAVARLDRAEEDADAILRERVAQLLGLQPSEVLVGRSCPRCGSSAHGRPWARGKGRRHEVPVSLSRCGEHLLTAVGGRRPLGVDLESISAVGRGWDPGLVLHPSERAGAERAGPREQAALWAGKEAVLKALGTGLGTPMSSLRLADFAVEALAAPPGHVAALARL
ncbi:MAG TPA: 4'-phosphopantetheinyl transferase superfamily protein [Brachybacterium sp.]